MAAAMVRRESFRFSFGVCTRTGRFAFRLKEKAQISRQRISRRYKGMFS